MSKAAEVPRRALPRAIQVLLRTASITSACCKHLKLAVVNVRSPVLGTPPSKWRVKEQKMTQRSGRLQTVTNATTNALVSSRI